MLYTKTDNQTYQKNNLNKLKAMKLDSQKIIYKATLNSLSIVKR